jgi:squalene-associated FAD-dependent desaturase
VVLRCCTEFMRFIDGLGMRQHLRIQPRFDVTVLSAGSRPARLRAARLPAPLHLAAAFLRYPHLSAGEKVRVVRGLVAARGHAGAETMATWLRRHGQNAATRRAFWDPFLVPALNAPLEDVAAEDALFVVRTAFLSCNTAACIGWTSVPLARIAERAAAECDVVSRRTAVRALRIENGMATGVHIEGGETIACDAVILAVPPHRMRAVLPAAAEVRGLEAFEAEPIVDVHLWYDRDVPAPLFAAVLDSQVQWVFRKSRRYLCCSLSAAAASVQRPEAELVALCDERLRSVIPELREAVLEASACTRDLEATFIPAPGLRRPGARTALRNVVIAGAWTDTGWPATMESAVRSGRIAAHTLLQQLSAMRQHAVPMTREAAHVA